jgi:uncharacterized protein
MIIPYDSLEPDLLERMLEEIVTRDGTDYGAAEKPTSEKINAAINGLKQGRSVLLWDDQTESASLVSKEYAQKLGF